MSDRCSQVEHAEVGALGWVSHVGVRLCGRACGGVTACVDDAYLSAMFCLGM